MVFIYFSEKKKEMVANICCASSQAQGSCVHTKPTETVFFLLSPDRFKTVARCTHCTFWLICDLEMVEGTRKTGLEAQKLGKLKQEIPHVDLSLGYRVSSKALSKTVSR